MDVYMSVCKCVTVGKERMVLRGKKKDVNEHII